MQRYYFILIVIFKILLFPHLVHSEEIGSVDTAFNLFGHNNKIIIESFKDPDVNNVMCYISRAKTGGIKAALGLSEDKSYSSISCQQIGAVELNKLMINGKDNNKIVFYKRTSTFFKKLKVVRFFDKTYNMLIYLVYSDKILAGSPKNALSVVYIHPWNK